MVAINFWLSLIAIVFCVSIALQHREEIIMGCIYNPMLDELFTAEAGSGAFLNGERIHVSSVRDFSRSFLATGFPYDLRTDPDNNINYFTALAKRTLAIRRAGSAALDLAYTAAGRFDGFWELKLSPWDVAAGSLLVLEAGGLIGDLTGEGDYLHGGQVIAANPKIFVQIVKELSPFRADLARERAASPARR